MSELKPYIGPHPTDHTLTEYYLKSEADRYIEELEESTRWKSSSCYLKSHKSKRAAQTLRKKMNHHKYRRCLAMAGRCRLRARWFGDNAFYKKEQWALKWHKRWLELAEKFKG